MLTQVSPALEEEGGRAQRVDICQKVIKLAIVLLGRRLAKLTAMLAHSEPTLGTGSEGQRGH